MQELRVDAHAMSHALKSGLVTGLVVIARLALASEPLPTPDAASIPSSPPVIEGDRIVDRSAHLSFSVPQGWSLREESVSGQIMIEHRASRSSFWVATRPTDTGVESEIKALGFALPFIGGGWHRESAGWRKIGGRKAGEYIGIRTYGGLEPLKQWDVVTVYRLHSYLFHGQVPQSEVTSRWPDLEAIVDSVRWLD